MLNINDKEVWLDMVGYEGRYQVSDHGRVRSIQTNHGKAQCLLKSQFERSDTCVYLHVTLTVKDKNKSVSVHREIAKAFVPNPDGKPMVNHKDGDKHNNHANNLEWVTCSENHKHAFATGLRDMEAARKANIAKPAFGTSKYKSVTWDKARGKWKAGVKHNGKVLEQKRFDTEEAAAKHVNWVIDTYQLNRPKNVIG